jgi:hypothetical protein
MAESLHSLSLKNHVAVDEECMVYLAEPAFGQFQARRTKLKFAIRTDGISVSEIQAEWLRSLGLSGILPGALDERE